tara:strand:+ start:58 stop:402 length:345 start_codon:yes stop_codon:yes gene_type:complete
MYIKLSTDKETILDHDYKMHGDYDTQIPDIRLVDSTGRYIYKWNGLRLVSLNQAEIDAHPVNIERDQYFERVQNQKSKKSAARAYLETVKKSDMTNLTKVKEMLWHLKSLVEIE